MNSERALTADMFFDARYVFAAFSFSA